MSWRGNRRSAARARVALLALCGLVALGCALAAIATAATPGSLDPSFGSGGVVFDQFGLSTPARSSADSVIVAPNGDIYVGGGMTAASSSTQEIFVARYTPAGVLDPSWGNGGVAVDNVGQGTSPATGEGWANYGTLPMALTADGNVIVATTATDGAGRDELAVLELTGTGILNPAFGSGGVYRNQLSSATAPWTWGLGLAVGTDGRPVITGSLRISSGQNEFFAERLTGNGAPDGTFDPGSPITGVYEHQYGQGSNPSSYAQAVIAEPNGKLTFAGTATDANGQAEMMILRLTSAGTPDPGFGTAFAQPSADTSSPVSNGLALAETAGGQYVVSGFGYDASGDEAIAAAEFNPDGSLNTSFASSGLYLQQLSAVSGGLSEAFDVAVQPDGKIDLIGTDDGYEADTGETAIVRLSPAGTLDPSFGTGGVLEAQYGAGSSADSATFGGTVTPSGDLLVPGQATTTNSGEVRAFLAAVVTDSPPAVTVTPSARSVAPGQSVSFTATATPGSGVTIAGYGWDLGSGGFSDATGATASRSFSAPGSYTVRVQATDSDGLSSVAAQTITVTAPGTTTPTTPTTTTTTTTPAPRPKLSLGALTAVAAGVKIKLACATAPCAGTVRLTAVEHLVNGTVVSITAKVVKKKKVRKTRTLTLGSARYSLTAGQTKVLTVALTGAGQRLLQQRHRLTLTLGVALTGAKPATVATRTITLRKPISRR